MCYMLLLELALESNNACSVCVPLIMECKEKCTISQSTQLDYGDQITQGCHQLHHHFKGTVEFKKISLYNINNVMIYRTNTSAIKCI